MWCCRYYTKYALILLPGTRQDRDTLATILPGYSLNADFTWENSLK